MPLTMFDRKRFLLPSAHTAGCVLLAGASLLMTGCGGGGGGTSPGGGGTSPGGGGQTVTYSITDLGTLTGGQTSYAEAINASGQVVGRAEVASSIFHGSLFSGSTLTDLGTLAGNASSDAHAINSAGQIVGTSETNSGIFQPVLVTGGKMTGLGIPSGTNGGFALGINTNGHIVGNDIEPSGDTHAFVYESGKFSDLGTLGGPAGEANAINDSDQIVGDSETAASVLHAVIFHIGSTTPTDLGTLSGDTHSSAVGINASGQIVGSSARSGNLGLGSIQQAFVYSGGKMTGLGKLSGDTDSMASAINASGQIVGSSSGTAVSSTLTFRAVVFHIGSASPTDLNGQLSTADHAKWTLTEATGINDKGQICGNGTINGQTHAFLLTPNPIGL